MMQTLGNAALASALVDHFIKGTGYYTLPDGWNAVGSGCNRSVYRHESQPNVVYKVDSGLRSGNGVEYVRENSEKYGNIGEFNAYMEWVERGDKSHGARLAHTERYDHKGFTVLAAEYIPNVGGYFNGSVAEVAKLMAASAYLWPSDLHAGNWAVDDNGDLVVIDFGHWSNSPQINWYQIEQRSKHLRKMREGKIPKFWCQCGCGEEIALETILEQWHALA